MKNKVSYFLQMFDLPKSKFKKGDRIVINNQYYILLLLKFEKNDFIITIELNCFRKIFQFKT